MTNCRVPKFLSVFFLFIAIDISGQQKKIDSLKYELELIEKKPSNFTNDTNKIKLLNALVWRMSNFNDKLDSSLSYAEKAISISEKVNWKKGRAEAYTGKAKVLKSLNKYEQAIEYYLKSASISKEMDEKDWMATAYYFTGQIYHDLGNYPVALDYYLQALRLNEQTNNQSDIARDLTYSGMLYAEIDDFDNALNSHLRALKIFEELKNKIWTTINLQAIAALYRNNNEFEKAIGYYHRVLDVLKGNIYSVYGIYIEIGHVYNQQSDATPANQPDTAWQKAMDYYSKGLKTAEELDDSYGMGITLNGMGWLYLKKNNFKEAGSALNKALNLLLKEEKPEALRDCYLSLSKLDSIKGNWKSSYQYFRQYASINDSLFNKKKSHELARLQIKYETDKKQEEITVLNKDNELKNLRIKQQRKNILLIISSAIILLLGAGGGLLYRNKRMKQQALQQIGKAKLASLKSLMDKHFIFSSLHSIDTFLMNHDTEAASDYLVKFSKLIRTILEMSNQAEVTLEAEVSLCKSYLELEKIRFNYSFDYEFSIDPEIMPQYAQFPSMLLQPLVENAVKHGVGSLLAESSGSKGFIRISIDKVKDNLVCTVTDNGKGLSAGVTKSESHRSYSGKGIIERVKVYNTLLKNKASFILKDNYPGVAAVLTLPYIPDKHRMAL